MEARQHCLTVISASLSSNDDYTGECDYALVHVTPEQAQRILRARDLFIDLLEGEPEFLQAELNNFHAEFGELRFFQSDSSLDRFSEADGPVLINGRVNVAEEPEEVRTITTYLEAETVRWEANPKHTEVWVSTRRVNYEEIEAWLNSVGKDYRPECLESVPLCPEDGYMLVGGKHNAYKRRVHERCPKCHRAYAVEEGQNGELNVTAVRQHG